MAAPLIGKLVVFGVGLIGGSFALALKRSGAVGSVVGIGRGRANLDVARAQRIADRTHIIDAAWQEELRDADLILLAAPVGQMPDDVTTVGAVRALLVARGGAWAEALSDQRPLRMACNQLMCAPDTALTPGCEVAFFPPVTGG